AQSQAAAEAAASQSQAAAEAAASQSAAAAQQTTPSSSADQGQQDQNTMNAQYGVVEAGEGPRQIAGRYGLSVDEFLRLNGMTVDNFYFNPGQQVRIK
ncbi:LysM peptidoglycan-binding domain-containing protein, partial [Enterococcus viikkiensis]|uniref:LysM peptidoglycan-binding domain-containing protein n=1 Tax=Enterococcus viikkiensis TaxID=930854 RepID=UPI003F93683E